MIDNHKYSGPGCITLVSLNYPSSDRKVQIVLSVTVAPLQLILYETLITIFSDVT